MSVMTLHLKMSHVEHYFILIFFSQNTGNSLQNSLQN
jgi:hypothetical protein